ncbi:carbapenem self-resistance protein CarG family protein [Celerinatantimonas sp. YJH-8]|uniref:carbapenem self-resistance protein CarG family protein n=1 Tax=Celerinatantimonas sp. YJH-8 TaxID=3228714 RepID=UPI0038BED47F
MKHLCLLILMFSSFHVDATARFTELNYGPNHLDLNSDGMADVVFYSNFDNNTSHPDPALSVYIKNHDATYSIVPIPSGDRFTLFGVNVSVSNVLLRSFGLIHTSKGVYLVISIKTGNSPHLNQFFKFRLYRIESNTAYPGVPLYSWVKQGEKTSKNQYMSADEAIRECLQTCFE